MSTTNAKRTRLRSPGFVDDVAQAIMPYVINYLVVAGGGGGAGCYYASTGGAGGGGGGVLSGSTSILAGAGTFRITVGSFWIAGVEPVQG